MDTLNISNYVLVLGNVWVLKKCQEVNPMPFFNRISKNMCEIKENTLYLNHTSLVMLKKSVPKVKDT